MTVTANASIYFRGALNTLDEMQTKRTVCEYSTLKHET